MANPRTVDIKLSFERWDGIAGPACRTWRRRLLQHAGHTDDRGWSLADCLLRKDEGAFVQGTGVVIGNALVPAAPSPLGVPFPGPAAALQKAQAARRKRLKESASYLLRHLDVPDLEQLFEDARYEQNGPEMFDYIMSNRMPALTSLELMDYASSVRGITILNDIGSSENTVKQLLAELQIRNAILAQGAKSTALTSKV